MKSPTKEEKANSDGTKEEEDDSDGTKEEKDDSDGNVFLDFITQI